jgi:hypothetical protein
MVHAPVHSGLRPRDLEFESAPETVLAGLSPAIPLDRLDRAVYAAPSPLGYYRGRTPDGRNLFIRIVPESRRPTQLRVDRIAEFAGSRSVSTPPPLAGSPFAVLDCWAFAYPWLSGEHSAPMTAERIGLLGRKIAELHAVLRDFPGREAVRAASDDNWNARRSLLRSLARRIGDARPVGDQLATLERGWTTTFELLNGDAQMIHNDLHPGNVLFNESTSTFHFLDFEEAGSSWLSPMMDLSWVIERFCLLKESGSRECARALLDGYASAGGRVVDCGPSGIIACIRLRCLIAIELLSRHAADDRGLYSLPESRKFIYLLSRLEEWTEVLRSIR